MSKNFSFWCPIDTFKKAKDKDGKSVMRIGGIASTMDKDSDGEFLDPAGFDLTPFKENGTVNWHHQSKKSPGTIIGEPSKVELTEKGLYLETDLYASSEVAQEVYKLAQTFAKDSKTRTLGYSIEGKVVERDPDNPMIVKKAIITGCAITHMPKNPMTFAEIIKGHGTEPDENEEDDDDDDTKKATSTTSAAALKKESLDGVIKEPLKKANMLDKIFNTFPGIDLRKAKKVLALTIKINEMKKGKMITDEAIEKAYGALGISSKENPFASTITKGEDEEETSEESAEESAEEVVTEEVVVTEVTTPVVETPVVAEAAPVVETTIEKSEKVSAFSKIEKAIADSELRTTNLIKSLGLVAKKNLDEVLILKGELGETKDALEKAQETIEALGGTSAGRKSVTSVPREREFAKGEDSNKLANTNVIQKSQRQSVLNVLDSLTFEKGYDEEYGRAMTGFEADGNLSPAILQRIKLEKGITII